jgi:hypothetical protein
MHFKTLRATLLSGFMMAVSPHVLAEDTPLVRGPDQPDVWNALHMDFKTRACGPEETVILGDTKHSDIRTLQYAGSPATLRTMKDCGIDKFFIEMRPVLQPYLDDFSTGRIDREGLKDFVQINSSTWESERVEAFVNLVGNARDAGISLLASDEQAQNTDTMGHLIYIQMGLLSYTDFMPEDYKDDMRRFAMLNEKPSADRWQKIIETIHANQDHPSFKHAEEFFAEADRIKSMSQKRTDDTMLHDFIGKNRAPGERVALMIGNGHPLDGETGIDVRLGPENTAWIVLEVDPKARYERQPDAVYDLTTGDLRRPGL